MAVSCWRSLASRVVVPVLRPDQNPWSVSWKEIADVSRKLRRLAISFQRTSTNQIPRPPPFPFGTITTVCHMHYSANVPSWNASYMMSTTFRQLVASVESSPIVEIRHWRRCSARIPEGPPERFRQSLRTNQAISSSSGMETSTEKCKGGTSKTNKLLLRMVKVFYRVTFL